MRSRRKSIKKKEYWHKQFFAIDLNIFKVDIGVCVNASEKEIKQWLKKISGTNYSDFNQTELNDWDNSKTDIGRMIGLNGGVIIILKFKKDQFRESIACLCHEDFHVVSHLCHDRQTPLIKQTDEIYAYLIEEIMSKILFKLY